MVKIQNSLHVVDTHFGVAAICVCVNFCGGGGGVRWKSRPVFTMDPACTKDCLPLPSRPHITSLPTCVGGEMHDVVTSMCIE